MVEGDVVYRFCPGPSTATRLMLVDRDTVGVQRLWARRTEEHSGGVVYAGGMLFGLEGEQHCRGYRVYDAATGRPAERRANRDICNVGAMGWSTVWTPTTLAGGLAFLCDRGSASNRITGEWASVSVLQARAEGRFIAHNRLEKHLDAPLFFDANCIYARTDWALVCIGSTGREGEAYEAAANAQWLMEDIAAAAPPRRQAIAVPPAKKQIAAAMPMELGKQRFLKALWAGPAPTASAGKTAEGLLARGGTLAEGEKLDLAGVDGTAYRPGKEAFPKAILLHECVEVYDAAKMPAPGAAAYFTGVALANDRPRTLRVILPGPHVRAWLAGREVADGDRATVAAGVYPLLAMVAAPKAGEAGPVFVRFEPSDDEDAEIKAWRDSIRDNRAILDRVIRLCPETDLARRAARLLKQEQRGNVGSSGFPVRGVTGHAGAVRLVKVCGSSDLCRAGVRAGFRPLRA